MTERSANYNLVKIGPGESLSADGYDFTIGNIDIIDRALAQALARPGSTGISITDPTTGLELSIDDTEGNIPAGSTVYYRYSYLDALGAETAASDVTQVTLAAPVSPPNAPVAFYATTGGSLLPGNYFYVLTAYVNINTAETRGQNRVNLSVQAGSTTNEITLTLPSLPAGADGFNVYRRAPSESDYSFLEAIDMGVATPPTEYVDDGSVTANCTRKPPLQNATNSTNSIDLNIPGATPTVDVDAVGWRIYRTYNNTNWTNSLLATVVEETFETSGIITPNYTDLGIATSSGSPLEISSQIAGNDPIDLTDLNEVDGYLPTGRLVVPFYIDFKFEGSVSAVGGTVVWRCPFEYAEIQWVTAHLGKDEFTSGGFVEVDVLKYDMAATPQWVSIFDAATPVLPTIDDGDNEGNDFVPTDGTLVAGDKLVCDVTDVTSASVSDLVVVVYMLVRENTALDVSPTGILGIA